MCPPIIGEVAFLADRGWRFFGDVRFQWTHLLISAIMHPTFQTIILQLPGPMDETHPEKNRYFALKPALFRRLWYLPYYVLSEIARDLLSVVNNVHCAFPTENRHKSPGPPAFSPDLDLIEVVWNKMKNYIKNIIPSCPHHAAYI